MYINSQQKLNHLMMTKLFHTCALLSDDGLIITLITAGSNVLLLINVFRADCSSSGVVT